MRRRRSAGSFASCLEGGNKRNRGMGGETVYSGTATISFLAPSSISNEKLPEGIGMETKGNMRSDFAQKTEIPLAQEHPGASKKSA